MEETVDQKLSSTGTKSTRPRYPKHHLRKRPPPKLPKREYDIYANNQSNVQSQLGKCQKLFEEGHTEIVIHGLGAAINTAVNLALTLQEKLSNTVDIAVNTSTVEILDDFEPEDDDEEPFSQKRCNSAVHVRVCRKPNFQ